MPSLQRLSLGSPWSRFHAVHATFTLLIIALLAAASGAQVSRSTNAAAQAQRGVQLAQSGDLAGAERELRAAADLAPTDATILEELGTILAMEQKFEDSNVVLERALKMNPRNLTARRYLAANLWQLHRYPEARSNLEQVLRADPKDRQSKLLLGMVAENMKDYATAARMLGSVPRLVDQRAESMAALARSYYHLGRKEPARATLRQLQVRQPGARGILLGAQIADEMGDYETAETMLTSVKSTLPDPQVAYGLALVHYHQNRIQESQDDLLQLTSSGYKSGRILNLLGWCYQKQGESKEAAQALEEAISLEPHEEANYLDLMQILLARRSFGAALAVARRGTEANPESAKVFSSRGRIELKMTQFTDAVASYKRAVELSPGDEASATGLIDAEYSAGMKQEAMARAESALKKFPRSGQLRVQFAQLLLKESEIGDARAEGRAEELLRSAVTLDPASSEAHYELGDLALKKGRVEIATRELETAARLDPRDAKTHFSLSRAYRQSGRAADAKRELDAYEKLKETAPATGAALSSGSGSLN